MKNELMTIVSPHHAITSRIAAAAIAISLTCSLSCAGPQKPSQTHASTSDRTSILSLAPKEEVLPTLLSARNGGHFRPDIPAALTLLHFSDLHGSEENLHRIVEFKQAYSEYIDDAIHTGDAVICYWDDPNPFENVPGSEDILICIGNHDCWKGHLVWAQTNRPYDATAEDAYVKFYKDRTKEWNITAPEGTERQDSPYCGACYYYKDYPQSKIRMTVLDCMHYDGIQDEWFSKTLGEAREKGFQVVGVEHFPPQSGLNLISCGFSSSVVEDFRSVPDPGESQMERMPDKCFATADKFIDDGGTFICWLSGHTHSDFIGTVPGHDRQVQIIVEKAGEMDTYMLEDRTKGTRNQDAFNLFTINPALNIFTIQRIGAVRNERMQSKRLLVYDYVSHSVLVQE